MSKTEDPKAEPPQEDEGGADEDHTKGPNLILLYSLIAFALAAAMALAALIVRPFYLRR